MMDEKVIDVGSLRDMLETKKPITIVDIRPGDERAEWFIPGSIHVDAYDALKAGQPNALASLELPGDQPVVTICGAGKTSLLAAEQLRARGFDARSLAGGMKAWSLAWNTAEVTIPGSPARVVQVRRTGKGCLSYLIGAGDVTVVIDPSLAPEIYMQLANQHGWTITGVVETHIHADHLSRSKELAARSGATLYLPAQDRVDYAFQPIQDGESIEIGPAHLTARHTPGHTLESTCYLLDNQALFTGDTLFLNSVGRPDLEASRREAEHRAHLLYRSLQQLQMLSASILVLPGHTSKPVAFDGHPIAAVLAAVRENTKLLHATEEDFVEQILQRIPPSPPNHHRIVELNEAGEMPAEDPAELEAGANRCAIG